MHFSLQIGKSLIDLVCNAECYGFGIGASMKDKDIQSFFAFYFSHKREAGRKIT